jgi:hypothetical protein
MSIAAIVIAVAGSAFSFENKRKLHPNLGNVPFVYETFTYEEPWEFLGGDPFDPANYERGFWQPGCMGIGTICSIIAREDLFNPGHPYLSPVLQFEILCALEVFTETNHVKLKFD